MDKDSKANVITREIDHLMFTLDCYAELTCKISSALLEEDDEFLELALHIVCSIISKGSHVMDKLREFYNDDTVSIEDIVSFTNKWHEGVKSINIKAILNRLESK